jgi:hypothetical protein
MAMMVGFYLAGTGSRNAGPAAVECNSEPLTEADVDAAMDGTDNEVLLRVVIAAVRSRWLQAGVMPATEGGRRHLLRLIRT